MPQQKMNVEMVKCSLKLPRPIWRESKIRALDEDRDWQMLVADALRLYLDKTPTKKIGRGGEA
jgi:hypothetical protein